MSHLVQQINLIRKLETPLKKDIKFLSYIFYLLLLGAHCD